MITCCVNGKRYIGITRGSAEKRLQRHMTASRDLKLKTKFARAIRKYGRENFTTQVVYEAVDWRELCAVERGLIAAYSPEYNITRGGEGSSWTPEQRIKASETRKQKMKNDPVYAARMKILPAIGWFGENRERRLAIQRSPERVSKASKQAKEAWKDPEYRRRCSVKKFSKENREKHSNLIKNLWKNPDWRAKSSIAQKNSWTPERREAQRQRHTQQFADPARRKLAAEKQSAYHKKCILHAGWLLFVVNKYGDDHVRR